MIETLSIEQLAERCRKEAERYRREQKSDGQYCFELFRLALHQQVEAAWAAIVVQYRKLVLRWVNQYLGSGNDVSEDPESFVNEAFTRMWQYGCQPQTAQNLDTLGKCLSYLKRCVWSAVEDHRRWQQKDSLSRTVDLETIIEVPLPHTSVADAVEQRDQLARLRQVLLENLQSDAERIVAEETWVYDQAPRQIQARYPEAFATVAEVSQTKRNILKRLKRKLAQDLPG